MDLNPNQETDSEQFVDMPGSEDVRPAVAPMTGQVRGSPSGEPEPNYGSSQMVRDSGTLMRDENPNSIHGLHQDREELMGR